MMVVFVMVYVVIVIISSVTITVGLAVSVATAVALAVLSVEAVTVTAMVVVVKAAIHTLRVLQPSSSSSTSLERFVIRLDFRRRRNCRGSFKHTRTRSQMSNNTTRMNTTCQQQLHC